MNKIEKSIYELTEKLASTHYVSLILSHSARNKILHAFPPKFPKVIAHHVTYNFDVPKTSETPDIDQVKVIGYASDNYIEALIVEVAGKTRSPDGRVFHITLSLDPKHRVEYDSNKIIHNWKRVTPIKLDVTPAISSF